MDKKTYKLKDFAEPIAVAVTDPQKSCHNIFVGLEHYDSGEPVISRFSDTSLLNSSCKEFQKNDILIARRNVYLRRAGIAPFDGLTSGDSIVLRLFMDCEEKTGVPYNVAIRIIPFVLNSNSFWTYANRHADGMNSKRISKEKVLDYEFELPSISEQKVLAEKLWAAYEVKQSYLKMIEATEEMVKSQFIEMFGEVSDKSPILNDVAEIYDGTHKTPTYTDSGIPFVSVENIDNLCGSEKYISENDYLLYKHKPEFGDVFMTRIGSIGKCAVYESSEPLAYYVSLALIKPNKNIIQSKFLKYYIESKDGIRELKQRSLLRAFPMKINLGEIGKIKIIIPPMNEQTCFVEIAEQADKTIFELRKSIDAIDKVIKSLINENL